MCACVYVCLCVCMCVCVCVLVFPNQTEECVHISSNQNKTRTHTCMNMHACACLHVCACPQVCISKYIHAGTQACTHKRTNAHTKYSSLHPFLHYLLTQAKLNTENASVKRQ